MLDLPNILVSNNSKILIDKHQLILLYLGVIIFSLLKFQNIIITMKKMFVIQNLKIILAHA